VIFCFRRDLRAANTPIYACCGGGTMGRNPTLFISAKPLIRHKSNRIVISPASCGSIAVLVCVSRWVPGRPF
jgi:hypothetical protein